MKKRALVLILGAFIVLGVVAVPLSPWRWLAIAGAASLALLSVLLLVAVLLAREVGRLGRRPYDIAMLATFAATAPALYLLDVTGPVVGILGLALLHYGMDAPRRWSLAATLLVAVPHMAFHALLIFGLITNRGHGELLLDVRISDLASNAFFYVLSLSIAWVYSSRTRQHLTELAEAGREVATREALLREARLELEHVVELGGRGRFTDQVLGTFRLGPLLGQGGLGEVYRATHTETGAPAAVKVLRPQADSSDALRRFEREAAIVGTLASPHIVRLLDVGGLEAPLPFLAMELLEGESGRAVLDRSLRMPRPELLKMVKEIGRGLLEAKEHNVVHRDIKPSNLFLTKEGTWKILDFGLGRLAGDTGTLTQGMLVGTLGYLAPEQLHGASVGHSTDIHALAIIAYQALTGRPAFAERSAARVFEEVEKRLPPRPSELVAVPRPVDDVLRIALAKDPADRFERATDFGEALAEALEDRIEPALRDRAAALDGRLGWGAGAPVPASAKNAGRRRRDAPTQTIQQPAAAPAEAATLPAPAAPTLTAPVLPPPPPPPPSSVTSGALAGGTTTRANAHAKTVTLVDGPEQLQLSTWLAPARKVTLAFAFAAVFSMSQMPLHPIPRMRIIGMVAVVVLFAELLVIRALSADDSERGVFRFRLVAIVAFGTSTSLLYVFGTYGDIAAFLTLAIFLFGQGVPRRWAIAATLAVALPHAAFQLGSIAGVVADQGFTPVTMNRGERLLNLLTSLSLYALGSLLAEVFRRHGRAVLGRLSEAFRRNTERDALLQDARLALERAIGVGQPGRFTGQRFGRFLLGDVLGRGGLGEVYTATGIERGERAAVKLMTRRQGGDPDAVARFERDAELLQKVDSPHVVRVLEVGHELELPFVAMERLEGSDLGRLLDRRLLLSPPEVEKLVSEIADGLATAHAHGLLHGDVAPRNVFLTDSGSWKLLDFAGGVAAGAGAELFGTPGFMAPEQLAKDGGPVDRRIDVHALASVAYRALTGRPAFAGRDSATVLYRVLHALPPAPSALVGVAPAVDDVLRIALAKSPGDRFADAPTFASALRRAVRGTPDPSIRERASALDAVLGWSLERSKPGRPGR